VATVALFVGLCSVPLAAQMQPLSQDVPTPVEAAALSLPDAPTPQTGTVSLQSVASQPPAAASEPPAAATPCAPGTSSSAQAAPGTAPDSAAGCPAAAEPTAAQKRQLQHDQAERDLKVQEKQRLLGVMPQFQVVMGGQAVPLTGGQKWKLALHSAIDPFYIGWAFVIGGGYGELVDSNSGYGWGADGYIKRVGANYADNVNGALIGNALLPTLLHQDPRYFRRGTGPIFKRFLYAAESTVVCHGDNGKHQANVSNVLGNYISGGISNLYYPSNDRGVKLALENGTSVTLFGALGGQILEFGPDLTRLVHHKRNKALPGAPATPAAAAPATAAPPASGSGSGPQ
jgi:hypothetical protein